jgi:SAM-dependent methyltransferase
MPSNRPSDVTLYRPGASHYWLLGLDGNTNVDERLMSERFRRASRYHPEWVLAGVGGAANPLWMTEWLAEGLDLRSGMRVLDLGCGRALSSIFLRREFGVQVWAADLWFNASENLRRVRDAGVEDGVFPIHADARMLPFAADFFDAIVSIDSFFYYGTDDLNQTLHWTGATTVLVIRTLVVGPGQ